MSHSILTVLLHKYGGFKCGVINQEYQKVPHPVRIRIRNLPGREDDIVVKNVGTLYNRYGSIYSDDLSAWLQDKYHRTGEEPIPLLKFEFEANDSEHIFTFVKDSGYKKISRKRRIITPEGEERPCKPNEKLSDEIWNLTQ